MEIKDKWAFTFKLRVTNEKSTLGKIFTQKYWKNPKIQLQIAPMFKNIGESKIPKLPNFSNVYLQLYSGDLCSSRQGIKHAGKNKIEQIA